MSSPNTSRTSSEDQQAFDALAQGAYRVGDAASGAPGLALIAGDQTLPLSLPLDAPGTCRMRYLLAAVARFLNSGGSFDELHAALSLAGSAPTIQPALTYMATFQYSGFDHIFHDRATNTYIRVNEGVMAERLSPEQYSQFLDDVAATLDDDAFPSQVT